MKKVFLLLLPWILLAGCHKTPEKKSSFRLNMVDDPVSLDPRAVRSLKDLTIVKQLFEGLMRTDETGTPQPALAERVEISDDLLTYTFSLREAYWTNGDRVTAEDFKAAWSKVLDPDFACDYSHMLHPLKNSREIREGNCSSEDLGVEVVDDQTLVVELESPTPYFLELTAFPTYYPVNREVDLHSPNWATPPAKEFVSNGPFKLDRWDIGRQLLLAKNENYWDRDAVCLERIALSMVSDSNTEAQLFEKNELDWLGRPLSSNINTELLSEFRKEAKLSSYPVAGTMWINLNTEQFPFDDVKMRKAFAYATNRQDIITHILQGDEAVATGPLPPSMALQSEPYFVDGNETAARQLFEKALKDKGLTRNTLPKVVLSYFPSERGGRIAQLLQQQWQNTFEIPIQLEASEIHLFRKKLKQGAFQAGIGEWVADYNDPISFLELFQYCGDDPLGNGMNTTKWFNAQFSKMIDDSMAEGNPEERRKILHEAEIILVDEMPIIPIYHYAFEFIKKNIVEDVILSPLGIADFKNTSIHR